MDSFNLSGLILSLAVVLACILKQVAHYVSNLKGPKRIHNLILETVDTRGNLKMVEIDPKNFEEVELLGTCLNEKKNQPEMKVFLGSMDVDTPTKQHISVYSVNV